MEKDTFQTLSSNGKNMGCKRIEMHMPFFKRQNYIKSLVGVTSKTANWWPNHEN